MTESHPKTSGTASKRLHSHPNPKLRKLWFFGGKIQNASAYYRIWRRILQVVVSMIWRVRVYNRHFEPHEGGTVYICNHQCFFDPVLMSYALRRPVNYMARDTLFKVPVLSFHITAANAFPIKRGTGDTGAMREAMRRVKNGGTLVLFAEGTRTDDGKINPFLPGVALIAQRAAKWTVPVLIEGAHECWPKGRLFPMPGRITIRYLKPIPQEVARSMKAKEFVADVRKQLIELQHDVRRRMGRDELKYDED